MIARVRVIALIRSLDGRREHHQKIAQRIRNEAKAAVLGNRSLACMCLFAAGRLERRHAARDEEVDFGVLERGGNRMATFNPLKKSCAKFRPAAVTGSSYGAHWLIWCGFIYHPEGHDSPPPAWRREKG
ncbi:MAG: hypothetical protein NT154_16855, partial [Verrucomicrobia bacterium]|nr:hypothetical protein [Verrucomicrobiota bacterium]